MSSGHAFLQRSPHEIYDVRTGGRRARSRSRSRSPGRKARRGSGRGHYARNADPESYRGGSGKSYRPTYDSPPRRVTPTQTSFDRSSPDPQPSRIVRPIYKKGDIVFAKVDQQKQHAMGLEVRRGEAIKILSFVSGNIYRCENLATNATGQLDRKVFEELPPPATQSATQSEFKIKAVEEDIELLHNQEIDAGAVQALQDVFFKVFEASVDTACLKLQRDQAEESLKSRTAAFNKSKEHHEKFPPLKESQTRQKLEAQKKLATLDEKHKQKTEVIKGLVTDVVQKLAKRIPEPDSQFTNIQKEHDEFKDLVKNQESLSRTVLGEIKILKESMIEVKKHADLAMIETDQSKALLQRVDELENQYQGLGPQVQIMVENEKLLRDNLKRAENIAVEQGNIFTRLASLENKIITIEQENISHRVALLENRVVAVEQGNVSSRLSSLEDRIINVEQGNALGRLGTLEETVFSHSEKLAAQQKGVFELANAGMKSIENSRIISDRLDRVDGQIMALNITDNSAKLEQRIKALESPHTQSILEQRVMALEANANAPQRLSVTDSAKLEQRVKTLEERGSYGSTTLTSPEIEARFKNLEARPEVAELKRMTTDLHLGLNTIQEWTETIKAIESRVVAHLSQSNKTVTEVKQLVAAVEHGLGNLRSRVDNIYTSDLAKAMLDQVQFVYPNLKSVHETVSYLSGRIGQINTELHNRPDFKMLHNALGDIQQTIDALRPDGSASGQENSNNIKEVDTRAVDKALDNFMTQYNMDYNVIREEIVDLKGLFAEEKKLIEEMKSTERHLPGEMEGSGTKATNDLANKVASLEIELAGRDNFIKEKLEVLLNQITKISREFKSLESRFSELEVNVNNLTARIEKLERRPGPTFSIKGAARPESKKRPNQNSHGSSKRRNTSLSVETDQHTMYVPVLKEDDVSGHTIEDSEEE